MTSLICGILANWGLEKTVNGLICPKRQVEFWETAQYLLETEMRLLEKVLEFEKKVSL